jgi:cell division transport system permease protein
MLITSFKRVFNQGLLSFMRSGLVSFASVVVMTVSLFILGSLLIANAYLVSTLTMVKDKVDVNVYFTTFAPENEVKRLEDMISMLPEVKEVSLLTKEQALARFIERNKDNALIIQSLDELGQNPLGSVLNIKANDPEQYASIVSFLKKRTEDVLSRGETSIIDSINYQENEVVINRLGKIIDGLKKLGGFVAIVLIAMAILVTFNTIRLAIYNARQEITVMRLVGASNSYIRGPFIIEGILYGIIASVLSLGFLYLALYWAKDATGLFFGGLDLLSYFTSNILQMYGMLLAAGIVLGMVSAYLAVRRYLDV